MKFLHINILYLSILWMNTAVAQSTHAPLRKGDRAYDLEQYKAAEKEYRTAADRDMGNPQAVYNLGNTLYQQGKFEDAEQRFLQVTNNINLPAHRADALHNLGNAFLKQRKYKEAVRAYEESLRARPADPGAKQNLQMAKKKLQEEAQKEKEKQQQQQQQEEQDQQNQNQGQPPPQNPQDQQDQPPNQPSQPQQNPQGQPPQPQNEQQKKLEEQRLKKEDAKRLLETAVGPDDRKNAQKYRAAQQQSKPKGSKKDW